MKFEENLAEIDEIIERLESGDLSLADSIKEYETAMKLLKNSSDLLNKAEGKVLKVVEKDDEILLEGGIRCYLESILEWEKKLVEDGIDKYLGELTYPEVIAEGMKYAVLNGGKRLRPILLFMTLDILGCEREKGLATASAIEMIHSYSLVHDDLPALDNDDYRRGKLTTHKKVWRGRGDTYRRCSFNTCFLCTY